MLHVVTGATGQLGSHIAEQLRHRGESVRALVQETSDTTFLDSIGVECVPCNFQDVSALASAIGETQLVYHAAARVSDWGAWSGFHAGIVDVTKNVLKACQQRSVSRVLYVSSISVYGQPKLEPNAGITEDAPLGQNMWWWDHYAKAKLLAEEYAQQYPGAITIVRPSWIYGPRDRVTIPRVVAALQAKRVPILGSGNNLLNLIYAGDVARGCILAATCDKAIGQAYNLCSRGELTQRQMLDTLTDALELPRITRKVPLFAVQQLAFLQELWARMIGKKTPPTITRRAVYLITRSTQFSITKAKRDFQWEPEVKIQEGVKRALEWFRENETHP
ncbi:MAG: NAD-dependent epimerase/dehydratase family protein [Gemmataceae bacterium]